MAQYLLWRWKKTRSSYLAPKQASEWLFSVRCINLQSAVFCRDNFISSRPFISDHLSLHLWSNTTTQHEPCIICHTKQSVDCIVTTPVCLSALNYAGSSVLVNQARASLFFNSKRNCESYIFYKLSAVKEGAKIKTINTVHNYLFLLPQPSVIIKESATEISDTSPDFPSDRTRNTFKFHGNRNLFRSLNVKTLTHTRLWHSHSVKEECLQCTFFSTSSGTLLHHVTFMSS